MSFNNSGILSIIQTFLINIKIHTTPTSPKYLIGFVKRNPIIRKMKAINALI